MQPLPQVGARAGIQNVDQGAVDLSLQNETPQPLKDIGRVVIKADDKAAKDSQAVVVYALDPMLVTVGARPKQVRFVDRGESLWVEGLKADKYVYAAAAFEPFQQLTVIC